MSSKSFQSHSLRVLSMGFMLYLLSQGPWTAQGQGETGFLRGEGHFDLAPSYSIDTYDKFYIGSDRVESPNVGRVTRVAYNLYAAYGLTPDTDVVFSGAYIESGSDGAGMFSREKDIQDGYLGVKHRVFEDQWGEGRGSFLFAPSIKVPLTDYENDNVTAIGDGQTDYRLRAIAHYECHALFASVESGYDIRAGRPGNEVCVHATVGYTFFNRVTVAPFYSNVNSLSGYDIGEGPFPGVEEDYQRVGLNIYGNINETFGAFASVKTTIDGRNTGDVDGFALGAIIRF